MAASIKRFGFVVPVRIDDGGQFIAGHGRLTSFHFGGKRYRTLSEIGQFRSWLPIAAEKQPNDIKFA